MKRFFVLVLVLFCAATAAAKPPALRIAHVMSYHRGWSWSDEQFEGFKSGLREPGVEYRVFEMDTKHKPDESWKVEVGARILKDLAAFKPDLVYLSDDNAQQYVGRYLVNKSVPVVFSGVNGKPGDYSYVGSKNVTGVLEREHVLEAVRLLNQLRPGIKRIVVLSDVDVSWVEIAKRIRTMVPERFPGIEVLTPDPILSFDEYKAVIQRYEKQDTAFASLGIYALKDEHKQVVPYEQVIRWTVENSSSPDYSFWGDRVQYGTLCAVALSGDTQGRTAGELARKILIDRLSPRVLPVVTETRGTPIVNLARARQLGLNLRSKTLLSAHIVSDFGWSAAQPGVSRPK